MAIPGITNKEEVPGGSSLIVQTQMLYDSQRDRLRADRDGQRESSQLNTSPSLPKTTPTAP